MNAELDWSAWSATGGSDRSAGEPYQRSGSPGFCHLSRVGVICGVEPNLSLLNRPVRMSGSGSSLFTLFDQETESEAAAKRVATQLAVRALCVQLGVKASGRSSTRRIPSNAFRRWLSRGNRRGDPVSAAQTV